MNLDHMDDVIVHKRMGQLVTSGFMLGFEIKRGHPVEKHRCGLPSFFYHPLNIAVASIQKHIHGVFHGCRDKFHACNGCFQHTCLGREILLKLCVSTWWRYGANDVHGPKTSLNWIRLQRCAGKHKSSCCTSASIFPRWRARCWQIPNGPHNFEVVLSDEIDEMTYKTNNLDFIFFVKCNRKLTPSGVFSLVLELNSEALCCSGRMAMSLSVVW